MSTCHAYIHGQGCGVLRLQPKRHVLHSIETAPGKDTETQPFILPPPIIIVCVTGTLHLLCSDYALFFWAL
jgi:hypothetical protein